MYNKVRFDHLVAVPKADNSTPALTLFALMVLIDANWDARQVSQLTVRSISGNDGVNPIKFVPAGALNTTDYGKYLLPDESSNEASVEIANSINLCEIYLLTDGTSQSLAVDARVDRR